MSAADERLDWVRWYLSCELGGDERQALARWLEDELVAWTRFCWRDGHDEELPEPENKVALLEVSATLGVALDRAAAFCLVLNAYKFSRDAVSPEFCNWFVGDYWHAQNADELGVTWPDECREMVRYFYELFEAVDLDLLDLRRGQNIPAASNMSSVRKELEAVMARLNIVPGFENGD